MDFPLVFSFWIPVILILESNGIYTGIFIMPTGIPPCCYLTLVNFLLDFRGISAAVLYKLSCWKPVEILWINLSNISGFHYNPLQPMESSKCSN